MQANHRVLVLLYSYCVMSTHAAGAVRGDRLGKPDKKKSYYNNWMLAC